MKLKTISLAAASVAGIGLITTAGMGIASASTTATTAGTIGTSGIPRSVFKAERLDAAATVLHTTTANVQSAHKAKTFAQLLSTAGLTKQTYATKLKAQLTTDLEAKGYTQDQVTIALQHRQIAKLHHKVKTS